MSKSGRLKSLGIALGISVLSALLPAQEAQAQLERHFDGQYECYGLYYGEPDGAASGFLRLTPTKPLGGILQTRARFTFYDRWADIRTILYEQTKSSPVPVREMILQEEAPESMNTPTHGSIYDAWVSGFSTRNIAGIPTQLLIIQDAPLFDTVFNGYFGPPTNDPSSYNINRGERCDYSNLLPEE